MLKITGMEEFRRKLDRLKRNAASLHGTHQIPVADLMHPAFMRSCSSFQSFQEMLDASPFKVQSTDDFKAIPDNEWDAYVRKVTKFSCWREMIKTAGAEWAKSRLLG